MVRSLKTLTSCSLTLLYFLTQVALGSATESNLWAERRRDLPLQVASLPSDAVLRQMPQIPSAASLKPSWSNRPSVTKWAQSQNLNQLLLSIPETYARIQNVTEFGGSSPIVLFQDVHLNHEAQTNTAHVLQELIDQDQVGLVGVEGAFAKFDFSPYRKYPNKNLSKAIADDMMRQNLLAAPSHVGITSAKEPPPFIGVDDKKHYDANLEALYHAREQKDAVQKQLKTAEEKTDAEKRRVFSAELKSFDLLRTAHLRGSVTFGSYLKKLSAYDVDRDMAIEQFLEAFQLESTLDLKRVETERKTVIEKLTKTLSEKEIASLIANSVAYRAGKLGFGAYYQGLKQLCENKGIVLQQTPHFHDYIRYVLLSDTIKADALFDAIEKWEQNILDSLVKTEAERRLVRTGEQLALAEKLTRFELTPKEWKKYQQITKNQDPSTKSFNLTTFEQFYRQADIRSERMINNLVLGSRNLDISKPKVLILGGFHAPHVAQMLREKKISHVMLSPKLTKVEGNGNEYLSVFQRDKTPLDRLFAGEKLFILPATVNVTHPQTAAITDGVVQREQTGSSLSRTVGNDTYEFRQSSNRKKNGLEIHNTLVSVITRLRHPTITIVRETLLLWATVKLLFDPTGASWLMVWGVAGLFALYHNDIWESTTLSQLANRAGQRFAGGVLLTAPIAFLAAAYGLSASAALHSAWNVLSLTGIAKFLLPLTATPPKIKIPLGSLLLTDFDSLFDLIRQRAAEANLNAADLIQKINDVRAGKASVDIVTRANGTSLEGLRKKVRILNTFERMVHETKVREVEAKEEIHTNPTNDLTGAAQWLEQQLLDLNKTNPVFTEAQIKTLAPILAKLFSRRLRATLSTGQLQIFEDRGSGQTVDNLHIENWTNGLVEIENQAKARLVYDAFQVWNEEFRFGPDEEDTEETRELRKMAIRKFENEITKPYGIPLIGSERARPEIILFSIETLNLLPDVMLRSDHVRWALRGGIDLSAPKIEEGRIGYYNYITHTLGIHPTVFSKREFIESFLHEFGHAIEDLHPVGGMLRSWFREARAKKLGYGIPALGESGQTRKEYIEGSTSEMFAETFMHYILRGELMREGFLGFAPDTAFWKKINAYYNGQVFGDLDFILSERDRNRERYSALMEVIAPRPDKTKERNFVNLVDNKTSRLIQARDVIRKLLSLNFQTPRLRKYLPLIEAALAEKAKTQPFDSNDPRGGLIFSLRWAVLKLIPSLAPIYNTRVAPFLENALVFAGQYILMSTGLDAMAAGLVSWGSFVAIHIIEWLITRDSGRNVGYSALITAVGLALNSAFPFTSFLSLQALPTVIGSTAFHGIVNRITNGGLATRRIPDISMADWTRASSSSPIKNPFPEITYNITIYGKKTVEEVYGDLFREIQRLAQENGITNALNINRIITMEDQTITLREVAKHPDLPMRFYDEEARIFEKHFPGYTVKGPSVNGPGAAIGQLKNYDARIISAFSTNEERATQVKRGELTLPQILEETKRLYKAGENQNMSFAYGFHELNLEGKVRVQSGSAQWLAQTVTALSKQDTSGAINGLSLERALGVEGIAGKPTLSAGNVSLDDLGRLTQDPNFVNAFVSSLPRDFKMEGKEAVLIASVLKAAGFGDEVVIALTKLQTKRHHVIAFTDGTTQEELNAGLALAKLLNQPARITMNINVQARFDRMKGKVAFALPPIELIVDKTNRLFQNSAEGRTFDATAFQDLSQLDLNDVALLHSKGLLINAGRLTPPLSILLSDLVPIVRDNNLGQIDRILRAILAAA